MPYSRPSLTALQGLVAGDISAAVGGADALLRFSNLGITGRAQAGLANLHYGYLDWIAKQAVPFTCTDEFLEGWAALKGIFREPAASATGAITFSGTAGKVIPSGTAVVRSDGIAFKTTSSGTIGSGGTVVVTAIANADPAGLTGAFGNTATGITMTLSQSIAGVQSNGVVSTAFTGGLDIESNDSLRSHMLTAYQQPPQGGSANDYESWAMQAPGVTRAWGVPNGFGIGTVAVYVMMDGTRAAYGGIPQGSNGVAAVETRGIAATGDQLVVANYLYNLQGAVGLVYVAAPQAHTFSLSVSGIPASLQAAVTSAVQDLLQTRAVPGMTLSFGSIWSAITSVVGTNYFTVSPTADVVCAAGEIPVLGAITYPAS
jgi:uncharacterized phage protein gp47/JayE